MHYENLLLEPSKVKCRVKYLNDLVSAANAELEPKIKKHIGKKKDTGNLLFEVEKRTLYSFETTLSQSIYETASFHFWLINENSLKDLV